MYNISKMEIGDNVATNYEGRVVKGVITSINGESVQILLKTTVLK